MTQTKAFKQSVAQQIEAQKDDLIICLHYENWVCKVRNTKRVITEAMPIARVVRMLRLKNYLSPDTYSRIQKQR